MLLVSVTFLFRQKPTEKEWIAEAWVLATSGSSEFLNLSTEMLVLS